MSFRTPPAELLPTLDELVELLADAVVRDFQNKKPAGSGKGNAAGSNEVVTCEAYQNQKRRANLT